MPLEYRVCGISLPFSNSMRAGMRNHRNCVRTSVADGRRAFQEILRESELSAQALAATKNKASIALTGSVNLAGRPSERIIASPEGPVWKLKRRSRYEAMKERCKALRSVSVGESPARRANIINKPKFCPV